MTSLPQRFTMSLSAWVSGSHGFTRELVGIDDGGAAIGEHPRDL